MGARWLGGWSWTLASFAGASHILQTNQAETQRRSYLFWVYGVPWIKHAHARGDHVFSNRDWFSLGFSWGARLYLMLAKGITPASDRIDRAIDAAGPERRRRISRLAKAVSQRSLFCSKLIGPNPRTIILGICMGLGSPIYYFVAEIMLLNLLLVASVVQHNIATRRLLAAIQCCRRWACSARARTHADAADLSADVGAARAQGRPRSSHEHRRSAGAQRCRYDVAATPRVRRPVGDRAGSARLFRGRGRFPRGTEAEPMGGRRAAAHVDVAPPSLLRSKGARGRPALIANPGEARDRQLRADPLRQRP